MKLAIKVEVASADVRRFTGKSNREFATQEVWLHMGGPYPEKTEIFLGKDAPEGGYPVGAYLIDEDSLYLDKNGRIAVSPRLKRLKS